MIRERVMLLRGISSALLIVENPADIIRVPLSTPGAGQFQLLAYAVHFIERYPILDGSSHLALPREGILNGRRCQNGMFASNASVSAAPAGVHG